MIFELFGLNWVGCDSKSGRTRGKPSTRRRARRSAGARPPNSPGTFGSSLSIGEDNIIYKWNTNTNQNTKWLDLETYATDHDWTPQTKGTSDVVAIGFADGSFRLYNKSGKLEKNSADAHKKSIISLKWSFDGGALATASQDGSLKIWSKNGSLRTNLVQAERAIYSVAWSPESDSILYCSDKTIFLKPLSANQQKQLQWKAHEGLILKLDWNPNNNSIVSCG